MMTTTRRLRINEVQPGDQIAEDVKSKGQLLVQRGTKLTDTLIRSLERRGIEELEVGEVAVAEEEAAPERDTGRMQATRVVDGQSDGGLTVRATETLNRAKIRLDAIFQPYNGDPIMMSIKDAGLAFWEAQAQRMATQPMGSKTKRLYGERGI
jgi:hypothetical protein